MCAVCCARSTDLGSTSTLPTHEGAARPHIRERGEDEACSDPPALEIVIDAALDAAAAVE